LWAALQVHNNVTITCPSILSTSLITNATNKSSVLFCVVQQLLKVGVSGSLVVKALCYKPEGRGFETRWGDFLNLPNPSCRTRPWGLLSFQQKWVPET
jgi:hypothetical protein